MSSHRSSFEASATMTLIDPRKIVNSYCTRPVLQRNVQILATSIEVNGYQRTKFLLGRTATCPEITSFYQRHPFCYSQDKAQEIASAAMKEDGADGHIYVYDGHLRRIAVLNLLNKGKLVKGFKIPCLVGRHLPEEEEIAFSISCNAVNEYSVPLSPLALLMRCYDFDETVNQDRTKPFSASDVAKRMVSFSSSDIIAKTVKAKMAETRRQYLSVSRRLSPLTVKYFRELLSTDEQGSEKAFNISNLKYIPKSLSSNDQLCLVKRMVKAFETTLPTKKPLSSSEVSNQVTQIKRASKEIQKFLQQCNFEKTPSELETFVSNLMNTQQFDVELESHANLDTIFPSLREACKNLVPGGTNRLAMADHDDKHSEIDGTSTTIGPSTAENTSTDEPSVHDPTFESSQNTIISPAPSRTLTPETVNQSNNQEDESHLDDDVAPAPTLCELDQVQEIFGDGVNLQNMSPYEFCSASEYWIQVEGRADFVIMSLPKSLSATESIEKLLKHVGMSLKETGVAHLFCTFAQFGIIHQLVSSNQMKVMDYPMIYVNDARRVRRKTLSKCPQENAQCAAIFWRHGETRQKPHFSTRKTFHHSQTPSWTNTVTHVTPAHYKVGEKRVRCHEYDFAKSILYQWCKPGGVCYSPIAESFDFVLACVDLGIRYYGLQIDKHIFEASLEKLLDDKKKKDRTEKIISRTDVDLRDDSSE